MREIPALVAGAAADKGALEPALAELVAAGSVDLSGPGAERVVLQPGRVVQVAVGECDLPVDEGEQGGVVAGGSPGVGVDGDLVLPLADAVLPREFDEAGDVLASQPTAEVALRTHDAPHASGRRI